MTREQQARRRRIVAAGMLAALLAAGLAADAGAQHAPPRAGSILERDRKPLPALESIPHDDGKAPAFELPGLESLPPLGPFEAEAGVVVHGFRILGSSVFDAETLQAQVAPFLARPLRSEDLAAVADSITRLYHAHGYPSSGALVPDQTLEDGVIEIRIIEGGLEALEIDSSGRLRDAFYTPRLRGALHAPLHIETVERALRLLQLDPRVARVDAVLVPSGSRGQSRLRLEVEEATPWSLTLGAANDVAPALGGSRGQAAFTHRNVMGFGDTFRATVAGAEGLFDFEAGYGLPVTPWLTEFEIYGGLGLGEVVDGDFEDRSFRSRVESYGASIRQPLYRSLEHEVWVVAGFERRRSEVTLDLGMPDVRLALETNGTGDGRVRLSLVRLGAEWVHRGRNQVLAARLQATIGIDVWSATSPNATPGNPVVLPDGEFQSGLLQLQWARRFSTPLGPAEWLVRGDLQIASGALFSVEAFSIGGASSVRGTHENELLGDNGALASAELRLPILPLAWRPHGLRLIPFVDFGAVWDDGEGDLAVERFDRSLASAGLGLGYRYGERFEASLHWGIPLFDTPDDRPGDPLQDSGLHAELRFFVF